MNTENEDADITTERITDTERTITYDADRLEPSIAVLEAVALVTETDEIDLEPLGRVVDPGALNALFDTSAENGESGTSSSDSPATPRVTFEYGGCDVTIRPGRVTVARELESAGSPR